MSATLTQEEVAKSGTYEMPKAVIGRTVYWYSDANSKGSPPTPAIITKVGFRGVNLSVIRQDAQGFYPFSGVRHISDPEALLEQFQQSGAWEDTPDTKLLLKLAEVVEG